MIVFICNHCPYVKAVIDRLVADARTLMAEGIGFAAICSNDANAYPADSFEAMQHFAQAHAFPFPYLHDEGQSVARAYGAVCTPDFFGYNAHCRLKYRGRLDEGRTSPPPPGARREYWKRCVPLPRPAKRRPGRCHRSAVPSSGRQPRKEAATCLGGDARPPDPTLSGTFAPEFCND